MRASSFSHFILSTQWKKKISLHVFVEGRLSYALPGRTIVLDEAFLGSESRVLKEEKSPNQRFDSLRLRQYLQEEAEKNQFHRVERQSPGGPDPQHHK
ncbi:hypothetical protein V6N13_092790 [Hibiscus sabdariffa]